MSTHLLAGRAPTLPLEKTVERARTIVRDVFFHNSSITPQVSRRAKASHQVLHLSTPNDLDSVVEDPRQTKSTLDFHAKVQCATRDSTASRHCLIPHSMHGVRSECLPFQGGGTGSNPVGGAPLGVLSGLNPVWGSRSQGINRSSRSR